MCGVNYVIEATESLNSKVDGKLHLFGNEGGVSMKDVINRQGNNVVNTVQETKEETKGDNKGNSKEDNKAEQTGNIYTTEKKSLSDSCGVKKVVVACNSPDTINIGIGINEDRLRPDVSVIGCISAPTNAILLVLKVILDKFKIRFCAYTFIKAILNVSREIKCPPLGPASHSRRTKWDFSENLVPGPCPDLEEEIFRFLPSMRGRIHGMVMYTPVPEVSMFDLTVGVDSESSELYREVCRAMKEAAEGKMRGVLKYQPMEGEDNSASCVFTGTPHSVVYDARSGCQIDRSTVKIVLWFDNEHGFAHRLVDLIRKAYKLDTEDM